MGKRIDSWRTGFGILRSIPGGIEKRVRIAALCTAGTNVVHERIETIGANVRVAVQIPGRVEEGMWITALLRPDFEIVQQRRQGATNDLWFLLEIPFGV